MVCLGVGFGMVLIVAIPILRWRDHQQKMVLVRGLTPVETLSLELSEDSWIRLCRQGRKDVVVLEKGPDPCSSRPVGAWVYKNGHLRETSAGSPVCDTTNCNRYRGRTDWKADAPVPASP
jgi:hypothetical protein